MFHGITVVETEGVVADELNWWRFIPSQIVVYIIPGFGLLGPVICGK